MRKTIFLVIFLALPGWAVAVNTGLVPCDGIQCGACDVVKLANDVIAWIIKMMAFLGALIFAWAGFLMVTSAGNEGSVDHAKEMMTNVVIGIVILMAGWLIADTVMKVFVGKENESKIGPWNTIQCVAQPVPRQTTQTGGTTGTGGSQNPPGEEPGEETPEKTPMEICEEDNHGVWNYTDDKCDGGITQEACNGEWDAEKNMCIPEEDDCLEEDSNGERICMDDGDGKCQENCLQEDDAGECICYDADADGECDDENDCEVDDLTAITDSLATQMGGGQTVVWNNPTLQACANKFIGKVGGRVTSAYRPAPYQTHLWEIKNIWCTENLRTNTEPICADEKAEVGGEVTKHFGASWSCGSVAQTSMHSSGNAVDISGITHSSQSVQQAASESCLVWRNYPNDPYHYDLKSGCTCQ